MFICVLGKHLLRFLILNFHYLKCRLSYQNHQMRYHHANYFRDLNCSPIMQVAFGLYKQHHLTDCHLFASFFSQEERFLHHVHDLSVHYHFDDDVHFYQFTLMEFQVQLELMFPLVVVVVIPSFIYL